MSKSKTILFLGYNREQTSLIDFLEADGHNVICQDQPVDSLEGYDLVVSFGYRFILGGDVIKTSVRTPINLHISYLPFNKGAHPNFWSWVEGTPSGVTIHELAQGLDTGRIIFQEKLDDFDDQETFSAVYKRLISKIEQLFKDKFPSLLTGDYSSSPQRHRGTYHNSDQLPDWMDNWDMKIITAVNKYGRSL